MKSEVWYSHNADTALPAIPTATPELPTREVTLWTRGDSPPGTLPELRNTRRNVDVAIMANAT